MMMNIRCVSETKMGDENVIGTGVEKERGTGTGEGMGTETDIGRKTDTMMTDDEMNGRDLMVTAKHPAEIDLLRFGTIGELDRPIINFHHPGLYTLSIPSQDLSPLRLAPPDLRPKRRNSD